MSVSTRCYDFEIPPERVAAHPRPTASQLLLTYTKATGEINHSTFSHLGAFLHGLITNFHYPRTSVLALTAAMCGGRDILIDTIYQEALTRDYLWFSYGDGMLIC